MQSLRDATALLILILAAISVRVTPADPQADALKGVHAATRQASLLPAEASAPAAVPRSIFAEGIDLAKEHRVGNVHVECNVDSTDLPDEASGVVLILEVERDGSVMRKVLVTDPAPGGRNGMRDC